MTVLLSTKALSVMLNLSVTTIKKLRSHEPERLPPSIKFGTRTYRYNVEDVEKWLKDNQGATEIQRA